MKLIRHPVVRITLAIFCGLLFYAVLNHFAYIAAATDRSRLANSLDVVRSPRIDLGSCDLKKELCGTAPRGLDVAIYVNDEFLGTARADAWGQFEMKWPAGPRPRRDNRLWAGPALLDGATLPLVYLHAGYARVPFCSPRPPFLTTPVTTTSANEIDLYGSAIPGGDVHLLVNCQNLPDDVSLEWDVEGSFHARIPIDDEAPGQVTSITASTTCPPPDGGSSEPTPPLRVTFDPTTDIEPQAGLIVTRKIAVDLSPATAHLTFTAEMPTGYLVFRNLVEGAISPWEFVRYVFGDVRLNTFLDPRRLTLTLDYAPDEERARVVIESGELTFLIPEEATTLLAFEGPERNRKRYALPPSAPADEVVVRLHEGVSLISARPEPSGASGEKLQWRDPFENGGLEIQVSRNPTPLQTSQAILDLREQINRINLAGLAYLSRDSLEGGLVGLASPGGDPLPAPVSVELYDFFRDLYERDAQRPASSPDASTLATFLSGLPYRVPMALQSLFFTLLGLIPAGMFLWLARRGRLGDSVKGLGIAAIVLVGLTYDPFDLIGPAWRELSQVLNLDLSSFAQRAGVSLAAPAASADAERFFNALLLPHPSARTDAYPVVAGTLLLLLIPSLAGREREKPPGWLKWAGVAALLVAAAATFGLLRVGWLAELVSTRLQPTTPQMFWAGVGLAQVALPAMALWALAWVTLWAWPGGHRLAWTAPWAAALGIGLALALPLLPDQLVILSMTALYLLNVVFLLRRLWAKRMGSDTTKAKGDRSVRWLVIGALAAAIVALNWPIRGGLPLLTTLSGGLAFDAAPFVWPRQLVPYLLLLGALVALDKSDKRWSHQHLDDRDYCLGWFLFAAFVVGFDRSWAYVPIPFFIALGVYRLLMYDKVICWPQIKRVTNKTLAGWATCKGDFLRALIEQGRAATAKPPGEGPKEEDESPSWAEVELPQGVGVADVALAFGPRDRRLANARLALGWGALLAAPFMLIYSIFFLASDLAEIDPLSLLAVLVQLGHLAARWLIFAFFFGYFFPYIRGRNGLEKGWRYAWAVLACTLPLNLLFITSANDLLAQVLWVGQVLIFHLLLGLIAFDLQALRELGPEYTTEDLIHVSEFHRLTLSMLNPRLSAPGGALVTAAAVLIRERLLDALGLLVELALPAVTTSGEQATLIQVLEVIRNILA